MSRIGKKPIAIPAGVNISLTGDMLQVAGPRGRLSQTIPSSVTVTVSPLEITVTRHSDEHSVRAMHGLIRSLIANMVTGVTKGYQKVLEINGVGYRAAVKGQVLNLNLGHSHPIDFEIPQGIKISVDKNVRVVVEGFDKQLVGQVAANIRQYRPVEPYLGKGIRYEGEKVRKKVGKTGA